MNLINIEFINFWRDFNYKDWINTYYHPDIKWVVDSRNKPDLVISSVFGSIKTIKEFKCKKILYVRENLQHNHYNYYRNNQNLFDLIIGFNDTHNQINIPYYYDCVKQHKLKISSIKNNNRKNLCLISRNPHPLRLSLIDSFKLQGYDIDCPGSVGNNMKINVDDKIKFIQDYYFNICPENSYAEGYTTEKLFDCCVAGCVPIYYGCERVNDGFYNKDRILHIKKDLSNYKQIIDQTLYLLNHRSELIEFMNQEPFAINYQNYIDKIKQKIHNSLEQLLLN